MITKFDQKKKFTAEQKRWMEKGIIIVEGVAEADGDSPVDQNGGEENGGDENRRETLS